MGPSDKSDTTDQARRSAGGGAYPTPHQNGLGAHAVNPFHLAIAELQADTDDMDPPPHPAAEAPVAPAARQTVVLTQPVRALHLGNWIAIGALAVCSGLLGGLIVAGASGAKAQKTPEPVAVIDPALAQDLDGLKTRTGDLSEQVDGLSKKLAALPPPTPPTDLSGLEGQLKALAQQTEGLSNTTKRVGDLESSANALGTAVGSLRIDAKSLHAKLDKLDRAIKALAERPAPAAGAATGTTSGSGTGTAPATAPDDKTPALSGSLGQGAELFRKGKYRDALGVFNKLEMTSPEDARVWYFAALCHGMATNLWGGGTAELVEKGIERERAGTPTADEIDAAFKDLTVSTGRDWLEQYRKRAR